MKYRAELDGLRAVAVLAVVFYHAGVPGFSGGFVGVDVFFVLSGFLITSKILSELAAGEFSLIDFYERRVRRIFPALFLVVIAVVGFSFVVPTTQDVRFLGESLTAAALFFSNLFFWYRSGYFMPDAKEYPLLHTWSLSIEEQFYLLFPITLLAIHVFLRGRAAIFLALLMFSSFVLSAVAVRHFPAATFYMLPTRGWELLIGGLVATRSIRAVRHRGINDLLSILGLSLIGLAVTQFSDTTLFPGPSALFPCLGTALIAFSTPNGRVGNIFKIKPLVFVGLISYSLYLWHWPLLYFYRQAVIRPLEASEICTVIGASFLLSFLSWRFVETPFRRRSFLNRKQLFAVAGAMIALTAGTGVGLVVSHPSASAEGSMFASCDPNLPPCVLGDRTRPPSFALWGDSHALALADVISESASRLGKNGFLFTAPGCPPLLDVRRVGEPFDCKTFNDATLERIVQDKSISTIILAARWSMSSEGTRYKNEAGPRVLLEDDRTVAERLSENRAIFRRGLERSVAALHEANKRVVIVGPIPEVGYAVPAMLQRGGLGSAREIEPTYQEFLDRQQYVLDSLASLEKQFLLTLILPHTSLCDEDRCRVQNSGRRLYVDTHHLSLDGSRVVAPLFDQVFTTP